MEGGAGQKRDISAFAARLATAGPQGRLAEGVGAAVDALHALIRALNLTPEEFRETLSYLTSVGHHADARRQEWVLLADAFGLSTLIEDLARPRPKGATPNTIAGPFYRADAPDLALGATICRDGRGVPLAVTGRILGVDGTRIGGARVEVWQANGAGRYENQEPDLQPEHNLRGRFLTDEQGRFHFTSVMPGGYGLPADGPVGQLIAALGLCLHRPAHIHFRVTAPGHQTLTTHIFDRADPAVGRDAIFGVKPELLADFPALPDGRGATGRALDLDLVLCPSGPGAGQ